MGDYPYLVKYSFDKISVYKDFPRIRRAKKFPFSCVETVSESEHLPENSEVDNAHFGTLSDAAKNNLIRTIKKFVWVTHVCNVEKKRRREKGKRTLKFVTLTLASTQIHSDTEIRNTLLNQFLTELRNDYGLKNYVWKAEKQRNGNIHFHMVIDIFIPWQALRDKWNRIQNKLGYVDRFREHIKTAGFDFYLGRCLAYNPNLSFEKVQKQWEKGQSEDWKNPPGTEIRNVQKIRHVHAYFAKYFAKEDFLQPGFGRIWFASRSLTLERVVYDWLDNGSNSMLKFILNNKMGFFKKYDFAEVIYFDITKIKQLPKNELRDFIQIEFESFAFSFW